MRTPVAGDIIRTNYGEGKLYGFLIKSVYHYPDNTLSFVCRIIGRNPHGTDSYLNSYRMVAGRCIGRPCLPGTAMWLATSGADHDEIFIEQSVAQPPLFDQ